MADTLIASRTPRVIDEHVIAELEALHRLSGNARLDADAAEIRADLVETLFAIECLPVTAEHSLTRARAIAVLHGGDMAQWQDDSPCGVLTRQIVEALLN